MIRPRVDAIEKRGLRLLATSPQRGQELLSFVSYVRELEAERDRLRAALEKTIDLAAEGWSYASEYFRCKWKADEHLAEARVALKGDP